LSSTYFVYPGTIKRHAE